jgi:Uncharacterized conserved protein (DUF2190)
MSYIAPTVGGQTERFLPADVITMTASVAVVGGRLVEITGNRTIGPAAAASAKVLGVALHDAAIGATVGVVSVGVFNLRAEAIIAAGDTVQAAGAAANAGSVGVSTGTDARLVVGKAIEGIAAGASGPVRLSI